MKWQVTNVRGVVGDLVHEKDMPHQGWPHSAFPGARSLPSCRRIGIRVPFSRLGLSETRSHALWQQPAAGRDAAAAGSSATGTALDGAISADTSAHSGRL